VVSGTVADGGSAEGGRGTAPGVTGPSSSAESVGLRAWRIRLAVSMVAMSAVAGQLPSFSAAATLWVLLSGALLLGYGAFIARRTEYGALQAPSASAISRRARRWPGRRALWWLVPGALFGAAEVGGLIGGSTHAYPTLSTLADPPLEHYPVRAVAFCGWLLVFWALIRAKR